MKKMKTSFSLLSIISIISVLLITCPVYAGDKKIHDDKKENGTARCTDGIDNDEDGLIDACDPDCTENRNEKKLLKWADCVDEIKSPGDDQDPYMWSQEGNLLRNPSADQGLNNWFVSYWNRLYGYFIPEVVSINDNPAFYLFEDKTRLSRPELAFGAYMSQDVQLPPDPNGKYLVIAGYIMTEGEGVYSTWTPQHLWSYFMDDTYYIEYPIRRPDSAQYVCGDGCWHPEIGIFPIPNGISNIRLFADVYWGTWSDPAGVKGYFDDLEMRVFSTQEEAEAFVDDYVINHPQSFR